ncbi:site-specific integrase [Nocardia sp. NBC_00881]|uniref:tyrosine-type recombinase/integrase n=1 Tax=Nocardia sp. NBC_00881 TaxID=2975995 RepID=UPI0038646C49|nr:site-specific integrase [Nocardia sp. NBC_00881]WSY62505.1 site-specific integrase [Nocardia sp. NBC_00881]
MTTAVTASEVRPVPVPVTSSDYLKLGPEERYQLASQCFPAWLLAEPIEFPPFHSTFGWVCRVSECEGTLRATDTIPLCATHARGYLQVRKTTQLEDYIATTKPIQAPMFGWALVRGPLCKVDRCPREIERRSYCSAHNSSLSRAKAQGINEQDWLPRQEPRPPFETCSVDRCVHDGRLSVTLDRECRQVCRGHAQRINRWLKSFGAQSGSTSWKDLCEAPQLLASVLLPSCRGRLSLANLPAGLQQEIRYALHRYANTARRSQLRPFGLQAVVDGLAEAGVQSLNDPAVADLAAQRSRQPWERRIWMHLPIAARSLMVSADAAKDAGWFDPMIVGAAPFPGTQGHEHRRKPWDLTAVTQRWLRDLLWDHLHDEALKPQGKRPSSSTISPRIAGIALLSRILHQNRGDHGNVPEAIGKADADALKHTWDLWYQEKTPLPVVSSHNEPRTLTETTRTMFMIAIRQVLRHGRAQGRTAAELDPFILSLPEYPNPSKKPRPRPLSYGDFQQLVDPDNLRALDAIDDDHLGLSDVWLAQAFQGGRISETLKLRLGCIGLVGAAQPYIWRDITKAGVVDYGMPCYLPVYERLLRRQEITRAKLRIRYRDELDRLDDRGQARLEASWDRAMPLFPRVTLNPDLTLEVSQSRFREVWTSWFESLGLSSITTHQTRATLATSLLNNGAPPALVRQLLGHFSEEALAHYANYSNNTMTRHLQQVWTAGPGMNKPGTILLRPTDLKADNPAAAAARIDLAVVPVEHGLCRYGPVVGGATCPYGKNCSDGPKGACEHFVLTGADLAYWERKRDAAIHFAEGAPTDEARDYILRQWEPWEPVLTGLRDALDELGLLETAENLDLRTPVHDYFDPLFSTGWQVNQLNTSSQPGNDGIQEAKPVDSQ